MQLVEPSGLNQLFDIGKSTTISRTGANAGKNSRSGFTRFL